MKMRDFTHFYHVIDQDKRRRNGKRIHQRFSSEGKTITQMKDQKEKCKNQGNRCRK